MRVLNKARIYIVEAVIDGNKVYYDGPLSYEAAYHPPFTDKWYEGTFLNFDEGQKMKDIIAEAYQCKTRSQSQGNLKSRDMRDIMEEMACM